MTQLDMISRRDAAALLGLMIITDGGSGLVGTDNDDQQRLKIVNASNSKPTQKVPDDFSMSTVMVSSIATGSNRNFFSKQNSSIVGGWRRRTTQIAKV